MTIAEQYGKKRNYYLFIRRGKPTVYIDRSEDWKKLLFRDTKDLKNVRIPGHRRDRIVLDFFFLPSFCAVLGHVTTRCATTDRGREKLRRALDRTARSSSRIVKILSFFLPIRRSPAVRLLLERNTLTPLGTSTMSNAKIRIGFSLSLSNSCVRVFESRVSGPAPFFSLENGFRSGRFVPTRTDGGGKGGGKTPTWK